MLKRVAVLYEDGSCIVLNKPVGLAVQGGKGIGVSLDSILAENWPQRPLLVHRLDRDTSGVILVAKTKEAAAFFSQLFDASRSPTPDPRSPVPSPQSPQKQYLAMCKGTPLTNEGVITLDLAIHGNIKKSVTHFRLLNEFSNGAFSLLELELGTGRMHQIRRHLAGTGNPVLGDDKYGDFSLNRSLRTTMQVRKLLLHASRLVIPAMPDGSCLDISAPLPDHFQHCIDRLSSERISNIP